MKNLLGLRMRSGRINGDIDSGMTGIQKATIMKKAVKRANKIDMISQGIRHAEMMEAMNEGKIDMD
jgi:hypothetical protein